MAFPPSRQCHGHVLPAPEAAAQRPGVGLPGKYAQGSPEQQSLLSFKKEGLLVTYHACVRIARGGARGMPECEGCSHTWLRDYLVADRGKCRTRTRSSGSDI